MLAMAGVNGMLCCNFAVVLRLVKLLMSKKIEIAVISFALKIQASDRKKEGLQPEKLITKKGGHN